MFQMDRESRRLVAAIEGARGLIVVLTGAGISLASGIPTFRGSDPGAIWARDITELATLRYFTSDPVGAWRWYRERFLRVLAARPNQAHRALATLERWQARRRRDFLLVTQNIDTLHERAGSTRVVKVHGSADRCRCRIRVPARRGRVYCARRDGFRGVRSGSPRRRHSFVPGLRHAGSPTRAVVRRAYVSHADYQWHIVDAAATRIRLLICVGRRWPSA